MLERLKILRKIKLKLNQSDFGEKIGLGQQSIANIENGKINLTERNFNLICSTFNVNPEWLRHGTGEIFLSEKKDDALENLKTEYGLNDDDIALVKSFLELPPEYRRGVIEWGRNFVKTTAASLGVELSPKFQDRPSDDKLTVAEKRKIVNAELDAEEKKEMLLVSISSSGSEKNKAPS